MARSHSALRNTVSRYESVQRQSATTSAASRYERVQPLRAAVGRKVERIINVGSVHTARYVARSEAATSSEIRLLSNIPPLAAAAERG
jgi:dihydrodipicolinate synthase/N-acetylneuraminate lyase